MKLNIEPLSSEDYDKILVGWWKDWGWEAPPRDFLPQNGEGGIMVYENETPICAGFLYNTNAKVGWVEWVISDKKYTKRKERKEALKMLLTHLTGLCESMGKKYVYALIKNPSLARVYKSLDYKKADSYNTEMIKTFN